MTFSPETHLVYLPGVDHQSRRFGRRLRAAAPASLRAGTLTAHESDDEQDRVAEAD